jgi:AmmeMemoRadiSam system protein B
MYRRKASYAGSFYSAGGEELLGDIKGYMASADPDVNGDVVAIVSPHAGYVYSGPVAAWSYKSVKAIKYDTVIVIAPSHRGMFDGFMTPESGVYETPLGNVEIDEKVCGALKSSRLRVFSSTIDLEEHSLEVQVPFLQYSLDGFTLVPVIVGTTDFSLCSAIADELFAAISGDTRSFLVVISTDLSHYHSYRQANAIDERFVETLKLFDEKALDDALESGDAEACGHGPLLCGMMLSKKMGAERVQVFKYATSGDTAGDKDRVVGYVSAAFVR